jgi:CheY-like chemotaxis protein
VAKILVVDDNPLARKLVVSLLSHDGHITLEAHDGCDGLEVARAERPQLVISDILMPSMDGYEFVRELRADPRLCGTPVIFHTANFHEREAIALANTYGIARVLVKPCAAAALLEAVEQVLAGISESEVAAPGENIDRQQFMALGAANARYSAFAELNVKLASEHDPAILLDRVCAGARSLFGARYAVVAARDPANECGLLFASCGVDLAGCAPAAPDIDAGYLGRMLRDRLPWRVLNATSQGMDSGLPRSYPPAEAFLAVPVLTGAETVGWICLADKIGAPGFDVADEQLLVVLAEIFGRLFEQGRLYRGLERQVTQLNAQLDRRSAE